MQVFVLERRIRAIVIALCAALLLLLAPWTIASGAPGGPPVTPPSTDPCAAQLQAANDLENRINAHNAQPHTFTLPDQQAAYNAYNNEAQQLNGEKDAAVANLRSCGDAINKLLNNGTVKPPTQDRVNQIQRGIDSIPGGFKPPTTAPKQSGVVNVMPELKPLWRALRSGNPGTTQSIGNVPLQGKTWPQVGSPNPVYPAGSGKTIQAGRFGNPAVSADHIVPIAEILYLPGFLKLPPALMYQVVRAPVNLQWLSSLENSIKSSGTAARISGADPQWVQQQIALQNSTRDQLTDLIQQLLKTLGSQP
jgi:hypothetical protein